MFILSTFLIFNFNLPF